MSLKKRKRDFTLQITDQHGADPNGSVIAQGKSLLLKLLVHAAIPGSHPSLKLYSGGLPPNAGSISPGTLMGNRADITIDASSTAPLDKYLIHVAAKSDSCIDFGECTITIVDLNTGQTAPITGNPLTANDTATEACTIRPAIDYHRPTAGPFSRYWYRIFVPQPRTQITVTLSGLTSAYDLAVGAPAKDPTEQDAIDWEGIDWEGIDWEGIDWEGIDWEGIDWEGIDWEGIGRNERASDWTDFAQGSNLGNNGGAGRLISRSENAGTGDEECVAFAGVPGWYYILVEPREAQSQASDFGLRVELAPPQRINLEWVPAPVKSRPTVDTDVTTVILVNETRLQQNNNATPQLVTNLMNGLRAGVAARPGDLQLVMLDSVDPDLAVASPNPGVGVYQLLQRDHIKTIVDAYADWDLHPGDPAKANAVAEAIRTYIWDVLCSAYPNLAHLVLIGNDDIIPSARVLDGTTRARESSYFTPANAAPATPLGTAITLGYFTTDDIFGTKVPVPFKNHSLWAPQLPVGRLIETPDQILAQFQAYVSLPNQEFQRAVVAGWDFVTDAAAKAAEILKNKVANPATVDDSLVGGTWPATQLETLLQQPRSDVVALACHSDQDEVLAAASAIGPRDPVHAIDIETSAGIEPGTVAVSIGCHSGLNVPNGKDNPEAFAERKAVYIANSGYGYGDTEKLGLSELLMKYLFEELSGDISVGQALVRAKQDYLRYIASHTGFTSYDEKAMSELMLFGMPTFHPPLADKSSRILEPQEPDELQRSEAGPQAVEGRKGLYCWTHRISPRLAGPAGTPPEKAGYYVWVTGDESQITVAHPTCPRVGMTVQQRSSDPKAEPDITAHGALLISATYTDHPEFAPHVGDGRNYYEGSAYTGRPVYTPHRWWPTPMASINPIPLAWGESERLVVLPTQFHPDHDGTGTGTERVYSVLFYDVYYSAASAPYHGRPVGNPQVGMPYNRPRIISIGAHSGGGTIHFEVEADGTTARVTGSRPQIARVVVTYTTGPNAAGVGNWASVDLVNVGGLQWEVQLPRPQGEIWYFVQAVDIHGNVGQDDNNGRYYQA